MRVLQQGEIEQVAGAGPIGAAVGGVIGNYVGQVAAPRIGIVRAIMLNHWYHHRGQLSVYLRALDVPLPSIYGPSADENPFA